MKKLILLIIICSMFSCSLFKTKQKVILNQEEISAAKKVGILEDRIAELKEKKLYEFVPKDLNEYLGYAQQLYPELSDRVEHLARKNLGQPYKIYLLGEFPFEIYDTDPLFCLEKSDCLVFTEHIYAMSLAKDWEQFFSLLQRIRYKDGEISTTTRNHSTIPQWVGNNAWLIKDMIDEVPSELVKPIKFTFNPNSEIISDYGLNPNFPKEEVSTNYIPLENISKMIDKVQKGDFVNVIRGFNEPNLWCSHVGFVTKDENGAANFLDSTVPVVKERNFLEHVQWCMKKNEEIKKHNEWVDKVSKNPSLLKPKRKYFIFKQEQPKPKKTALYFGFKFYHIQDNALENLIAIDGKDAPRVTGPRGLLINRKDIPVTNKAK